MRTIIALTSALLSGPALADTVRHLSVPERLWGKWAPSADLCRDDKAVFVVSAKGYASSQEKLYGAMGHRNRGRAWPDLLRAHPLHEPGPGGADHRIRM